MKQKHFLKNAMISNLVPIVFLALTAVAVPLSGLSARYLAQEMISRLQRDSLLVISLIIPVLAGMGLNFGMVLGAMAGQIGLILVVDWGIGGIPALLLAALIGTPISILLGYFSGYIMNLAKGREMVTSYIIGFFTNGAYQFVLLYLMGSIIPITNAELLLSRGYGIRNTLDLPNIRQTLDNLLTFNVMGLKIPVATFLTIAVFCFLIVGFKKTKLGQDMRAVGKNRAVANGAGIPVEKTRILAIILSTIIACYGQIVSLQNLGTINTYNSHEQVGMFSIAALLVGGATAENASIFNVFIGVFLFHLLFVVSPMAGKNLIGDAQLGEFFRVFVSYGIIAVSLLLHAWKKRHALAQRRRLENEIKE